VVRYELILRRYPKLSAADIAKRMADLPDEFSEGTLERALKDPAAGAIAIAWGDSRKRLLLIQRRIELLGGAAELVDRAGPFAKRVTELKDRVTDLWRKPPGQAARAKTVVSDPGRLSVGFVGLVAAAALGAFFYAQREHDAAAHRHALQAGAFAIGTISAQLFVRGVRRWFSATGSAWLSAGLVLLPTLTLMAAGYEAHELGLVQRSMALIANRGRVGQAKPLMKPFEALLVELRHRKQRAELAAALASDRAQPAVTPGQPTQSTVATVAPGQAEPAAATAPAADSGKPAARSTRTSARSSSRARRARDRKADMTSSETKQLAAGAVELASAPAALQPTAAEHDMTAVVPASGQSALFVWPTAVVPGAGWDEDELSLKPAAAGPGAWLFDRSQRCMQPTAARHTAASISPAIASAERAPAKSAPAVLGSAPGWPRGDSDAQSVQVWGPLRSIGDVNEIQAGLALLFAASMFALGVWSGRRRSRPLDTARPLPLEAAELPSPTAAQGDLPSEFVREPVASSPIAAPGDLSSQPVSESVAPSVRAVAPTLNRAPSDAAPAFEPAPTHAALPRESSPALAVESARVLAPPSAANDNVATVERPAIRREIQPRASPPQREVAIGSSHAARGGVQEEQVVRRRNDARRDD
jgi:hypothetical protein